MYDIKNSNFLNEENIEDSENAYFANSVRLGGIKTCLKSLLFVVRFYFKKVFLRKSSARKTKIFADYSNSIVLEDKVFTPFTSNNLKCLSIKELNDEILKLPGLPLLKIEISELNQESDEDVWGKSESCNLEFGYCVMLKGPILEVSADLSRNLCLVEDLIIEDFVQSGANRRISGLFFENCDFARAIEPCPDDLKTSYKRFFMFIKALIGSQSWLNTNQSGIEHLTFRHCPITPLQIQDILLQIRSLKSLIFDSSPINDPHVYAIEGCARRLPSLLGKLKVLRLSGNIGLDAINAFFNCLDEVENDVLKEISVPCGLEKMAMKYAVTHKVSHVNKKMIKNNMCSQ